MHIRKHFSGIKLWSYGLILFTSAYLVVHFYNDKVFADPKLFVDSSCQTQCADEKEICDLQAGDDHDQCIVDAQSQQDNCRQSAEGQLTTCQNQCDSSFDGCRDNAEDIYRLCHESCGNWGEPWCLLGCLDERDSRMIICEDQKELCIQDCYTEKREAEYACDDEYLDSQSTCITDFETAQTECGNMYASCQAACPPDDCGCTCSTPPTDYDWADLSYWFPSLARCQTCILGPKTGVYNCAAWTVGITSEWVWWDIDTDLNRKLDEQELNAFYDAHGVIGITYYGFSSLDIKHVSIQNDGNDYGCRNTSKLGSLHLIAHDESQIECPTYGTVVGEH